MDGHCENKSAIKSSLEKKETVQRREEGSMDNAADTQVVLVPHVPANIAHALVCVWAQSVPRIRAVAAERRLRAKRVEMCMGASGCLEGAAQ